MDKISSEKLLFKIFKKVNFNILINLEESVILKNVNIFHVSYISILENEDNYLVDENFPEIFFKFTLKLIGIAISVTNPNKISELSQAKSKSLSVINI